MQCSYLSCHYFAMPYLQSAALTQPPRRSPPSGSKNHRTTLYCRQAAFHCNRSTEIRFGGSALLHRCYAPDIVRSQPRTASLLSGNSVLRAVFGSGRPTRRCWLLCFKDSALGGREESPPRSSPERVSGARQQIINLRQLAVDCKSASTCKVALCAPQWPFPVPD